jgi:cellulose synthase/poly-beta-1,6-N-acetylglucosamine synthase-like glycosyltransferase
MSILEHGVIYTGITLILATAALLVLGHRWKTSHRLLSVLTVGSCGAVACLLERLFTGKVPYLGVTMVVTVVLGAAVALAFKHWNPIGHTTFAAVLAAIVALLCYAAALLPTLQLGVLGWTCAVLLLVLQFGVFALLVAHSFEIIDVICRTRWRREGQPKIVPGYFPKVSLHVPTRNEPPEIVIETLNALARLDYPNYEVLVVDNNTAQENLWRPVQRHCQKLGPRFHFFHLMPWPGYKSGALNFALSRTSAEAEIVGVVDADYVVEPDYLSDLVGHFTEPRVAFVQTPQDYRDARDRGRFGRALYLAYAYFFRISMATRNEYNAIIYAGTMGLIRRAALEEVGGWDEWCITEDAELAVRLLDAGHESVYIDQTYGRGLMPLDYAGLKRQRFRWAFGGMQLLRLHGRRLLNPRARGSLTLAQRFAFVSGGLQWLNDPATVAFTFILLTGTMALLLGASFRIQPLAGFALLMPILLIVFAVARFLWAFRIRNECTQREAVDALTILMGLTWVVTMACLRGLLSRQGVFLRTPKQGAQPSLMDTLHVVKWDLVMGTICLAGIVALVADRSVDVLPAAQMTLVLLAWQALIFFSAVRTGFWSWEETQVAAPAARPNARHARQTRYGTRFQTGVWLVLAFALLGSAFALHRDSGFLRLETETSRLWTQLIPAHAQASSPPEALLPRGAHDISGQENRGNSVAGHPCSETQSRSRAAYASSSAGCLQAATGAQRP